MYVENILKFTKLINRFENNILKWYEFVNNAKLLFLQTVKSKGKCKNEKL